MHCRGCHAHLCRVLGPRLLQQVEDRVSGQQAEADRGEVQQPLPDEGAHVERHIGRREEGADLDTDSQGMSGSSESLWTRHPPRLCLQMVWAALWDLRSQRPRQVSPNSLRRLEKGTPKAAHQQPKADHGSPPGMLRLLVDRHLGPQARHCSSRAPGRQASAVHARAE